ncbi:MAG: single-stranded-DNA-specific exonuclease RecJ [Candidatus Latescibacteria bacterium]|nr:single-stranded-DNA-specific exonuclease RecJ [Candidatus Latescibacterota bacterium]
MRRYPIWHIRHPGDYDSLADVILANRSLTLMDLSDGSEGLRDPFLMKDMDLAVERLLEAIRRRERIVVFGDYDADGVTSTAVLLDFLDRVGADADYLLPDRYRDGYGMKPPGVRRALERGARLIVTADNGISSFEAIEAANASGVDVVVIDHHHPPERLPAALAVVNPNRVDCAYPFKGLAAVGVAFKVVQALAQTLMAEGERRSYLNSLLDLVALGSVADVAPVTGENRLLIRRGMQVLDQTTRAGLRALREATGSANRPVDTTMIGFFLGPRINSAGRLASADLALSLLRCQDAGEAAQLAGELNALNTRRQELQSTGMAEAQQQVGEEELDQHRILVVRGDDWHLGVVGLIAGRLADAYWRPAVVCTDARKNGVYTGSARTAGGYNIVQAVFRCADLLTDYGGHADAAGFSFPCENYEAFRDRLIEDADRLLSEDRLTPRLELDVALRPSEISLETVSVLSALAPFGTGNECPRFLLRDCRVESCYAVGQGAHLKLTLDAGGQSCDAIWWRQGELVYLLSVGDRVDAAFALEANTYRGQTRVQLVLDDLRPANSEDDF